MRWRDIHGELQIGTLLLISKHWLVCGVTVRRKNVSGPCFLPIPTSSTKLILSLQASYIASSPPGLSRRRSFNVKPPSRPFRPRSLMRRKTQNDIFPLTPCGSYSCSTKRHSARRTRHSSASDVRMESRWSRRPLCCMATLARMFRRVHYFHLAQSADIYMIQVESFHEC